MLKRQAHMTSQAQPLSAKLPPGPILRLSSLSLAPHIPSVCRTRTITTSRSNNYWSVFVGPLLQRAHVLSLVNCTIMPLPAHLFAVVQQPPSPLQPTLCRPCKRLVDMEHQGDRVCKYSFATHYTSAGCPTDIYSVAADFIYAHFMFE